MKIMAAAAVMVSALMVTLAAVAPQDEAMQPTAATFSENAAEVLEATILSPFGNIVV
jgi:hypothetical protein